MWITAPKAIERAKELSKLSLQDVNLRSGNVIIDTCGRFRIEYEDILTNTGFSDPALGVARRQCFCDVLQYIENTINVPAGDGSYIQILIRSEDDVTSGYLAYATPLYTADFYNDPLLLKNARKGFHSTLLYKHLTTGNRPTQAGYDAELVFNFGYDIGNDCAAIKPGCAFDFYSIAMHELTHAMGWASVLNNPGKSTSIKQVSLSSYLPEVYTRFDSAFLYFGAINGAKTKIIDNNNLQINAGFEVGFHDSVWLHNSTANLNQPVISNGSGQSFSHLDDTYSIGRCHESPGFQPNYLMSGSFKPFQLKREWTPQELRALEILGYTIEWSSTGVSPANHPPFLQGSVITNEVKRTLAYNDIDIQFGFPGGNQNLYLTTNSCNSVEIDLSARPELSDADGDPIRIFPNSLYNIRGCGNRGNNHNQLSFSSGAGGDVIIFTPRNNFIGRAQFGFHLWDGIEKGSFVVYTIDVTRNNNCFNNGVELIINGNFEEGSEVALLSNPAIENHVSLMDISTVARPLPLWNSHLSDGMAINYSSADLIIEQSWNICKFGHPYYSFGPGNHPASTDGSSRYLQCVGGELVYFNLADALTNCNKYTLQFDARVVPDAQSTEVILHVGFNDHYGDGTAMLPIEIVLNTATYGTDWFHFTVDFLFPFQVHYNWMAIEPVAPMNAASILIDNISLQQAPDNNLPMVLNVGNDATICSNNGILFNPDISGGTGVYTYLWDFGDGTTSAIRAPSHTYTNAGNYQVTLTVTDEFGCIAPVTDIINITVFPTPSISFEMLDIPSFCPGETISFTGTIAGGTSPFSILWNFGDGTTSDILSPEHIYATKGFFYPSLTVVDNVGCSDSIQTEVPVNGLKVDLTTPGQVCTGGSINFSAIISEGTIPYTYFWNFGDGMVSSNESPDHSYQEGNKYFNYTLTATDINGCDGIASSTIYVQNIINVDIHNSDTIVCSGDSVQFTASVSGGNMPYSYYWHNQLPAFSQNFLSDDFSPVITFNSLRGVNEITLEVTDNNGCVGKDHVDVDVSVIVANATFTPDMCVLCNGTLRANPTGGTPPYLYLWDVGNNYFTGYPDNITTQVINNVCNGSHYLELKDANGCKMKFITDYNTPNITISKIDTFGTFVSKAFPDTMDINNSYDIYGDETWSSDKKISGKIVVHNGAKLTINNGAVIEFAPSYNYSLGAAFNSTISYHIEPRIEVKRGGKLIVDGATLTGLSSCNSMWDGIVVEGDPGQVQPNNGYISNNPHGFVHLKNGAKIENAKIGVLLGRESDIIYSEASPGGLLKAENSFFINNEIAIAFKEYTYNNKSKIQECTFETNDLHRGTFNRFLHLESILKLKIDADTFRYSGSAHNYWGTGIYSFNSSFDLIAAPGSSVTQSGTSIGKRNYFEGLVKGIDAYATGGLLPITIRDNYFVNVYMGIVANGTHFDEIRGNYFKIPSENILITTPYVSHVIPNWGIYMYNTAGYLVTENIFHNPFSYTKTFESYGIVSRNSSGLGGEIYNNAFINMKHIATQAEQNNRNLQIKCNNYTDNYTDWQVTSGTLADQGECIGFDPQTPAGNLFQKNCVNVSQIQSTISFEYRHHTRTTQYWTVQPDCYSQPVVSLKQCDPPYIAASCPAKAPGGGGKDTGLKLPPDVINKKNPVERQLQISSFIRNLIRVENLPISAVVQVLQSLDNLESKKILVPTFLAEKDFGICHNTLNEIPYDTDENIQYHKLFDHLVNFCETGKPLEKMEEHEKQIIRDVANTNTEVAVNAEAYLTVLDKKEYWRVPEKITPVMSKTVMVDNKQDSIINIETINLDVIPNPFSNKAALIAYLPEEISSAQLLVYDVTGHVVEKYALHVGKNELSLNFSQQSKGIYMIKILGNNGTMLTQKIVVY